MTHIHNSVILFPLLTPTHACTHNAHTLNSEIRLELNAMNKKVASASISRLSTEFAKHKHSIDLATKIGKKKL